jgi:hypothetical protein
MTEINDAKRLILTDWEKKRDDLDVLISALRRELGISADSTPGDPILNPQTSTAPVRVEDAVTLGDFFGMSQVSAAKEFLTRLNKRTATLNEIGSALYRGKCTSSPLEEKSLKNLSSLLSRSDDFISVAKSRWGLSEWYPNRAKKSRKGNGEAIPPVKEDATQGEIAK